VQRRPLRSAGNNLNQIIKKAQPGHATVARNSGALTAGVDFREWEKPADAVRHSSYAITPVACRE
jgi:hypothetical protein